MPSTALEGFGLTSVESLASGTPALVAPVGGLHPLVRSALVTTLVCTLMTYLVMPNLTRVFYRWLYAAQG